MSSKRYFLSLRQPTFHDNYEVRSTNDVLDFISPDFPNKEHYVANYPSVTDLITTACREIEGLVIVSQEDISASKKTNQVLTKEITCVQITKWVESLNTVLEEKTLSADGKKYIEDVLDEMLALFDLKREHL